MDQVKPEKNTQTMYSRSAANPAVLSNNVTASDTDDLAPWARALRVGVSGDLTIQNADGELVLFSNVQDGEIIPCMVKRVMATNTSASNFVAYYG